MNEKLPELREKANRLPLLPGVYIMKDARGEVIYVGKAKALKNRVSSYFRGEHLPKVAAMADKVDDFDVIVVSTEFEALALENSLIKRHKPYYNILLKDDKGYPYIRLDDKSEYPTFSLTNRYAKDGARYFGPFGGRAQSRDIIDTVCKALLLPTCTRKFPRDIGKQRPCLNYHMGACAGWCMAGHTAEEYHAAMEQAAMILSGKTKQLTEELTEKMLAASEELKFELAASYRDRIRAISVLGKQQQVIAGVCADTDVWGIYVGQVRSGCAVLHIEDGNLLGREVEVFPTAADEALPAVLAAVLILLAGAFVWGILGRLETTVPAVVISRDGAAVCCYDTAYGAEVGAGMPVRVGGEELSLVSVSSEAVQLGADAPEAGFDAGQYVYVSELSGSVGDGVYEAEIVVDSIAPLSFLWN